MGSAADNDLDLALTALNEQHGEEITFREAKLMVNIQWPEADEATRQSPDFSERIDSVIMLRRTDIDPLPRSGETAADSFGQRHRVVRVKPRGDVIYLECKVVST